MSTGKPPHRFVPTLTEVVRPGEVPQAAPIDAMALAEQVLQTIKPRLEQQLRASLQAAVEEQMRAASVGWERDIRAAVQTAVARAMAKTPHKP